MTTLNDSLGKRAVKDAVSYLKSCGIKVPRFKLTDEPGENQLGVAGSYVISQGKSIQLNIGRYPTSFLRNWFAMHELGHVLWAYHHPLRWKRFRSKFGDPAPEDYSEIHGEESWKTVATFSLSRRPGPHRPTGEPSWYGAKAGGEERFCELLALMWANGDFSQSPPPDLEELWESCWNDGLARMT